MSSGAPRFPDAALEWLVGERTDRHVLTLGPGAGLPRKLARRGQHVWCIVDDDHDLNPRPDLPELQYVVARPESLPFERASSTWCSPTRYCTSWRRGWCLASSPAS